MLLLLSPAKIQNFAPQHYIKDYTMPEFLEAAEILEHFQWREEAKDKKELASELADVALYLLQLASVSGIDLEQAILDKLKINASREWDVESKQVDKHAGRQVNK